MTINQRTIFSLWLFLASIIALLMFGTARASDLDCEGATHCVLMSFPRHHTDAEESDLDRWDRTKAIAEAIDAATDKRVERAWLLMTARRESHLARYVDFDWPLCRDADKKPCDSGRAFGLLQIHGTDRDMTRAEMFAHGLRLFRKAGNYCGARGHEYWVGGTAHYARGGLHCEWPEAESRIEEMWRIHWRLGASK